MVTALRGARWAQLTLRLTTVGCLAMPCLAMPCIDASPARAEPHDGPALTLEQALKMVRTNHPKLARSRAAVAHARAREQLAWSRYMPGITGEFSYAPETPNYVPSPAFRRVLERRTEGGVARVASADGSLINVGCVGTQGGSTCDQTPPSPLPPHSYRLYDFWTARVGISWTLFDWGSTTHATRAAKAFVEARQHGLEATLAQVVLETKLAYYDVLAAEAAVSVALDQVAARERHVQTARALQAAGRHTALDVSSAESAEAEAELLLVRARGGVAFARQVLAVLTGDDAVRDRALVAPFERAREALQSGAELERTTDLRPELRELASEAKGMRDLSASARGAYMPQLHLQAGPSWSGSKLNELIPNFGAVIALRFPGSQGMNPLMVSANVKEAAAQSAMLSAQREVVRDELRLQAESARIDLLTATQAELASKKVVELARKRRDQAEVRYRGGVGTFLELSDAELALASARFDEVGATFDIGRAQSKLDRALGAQ